MVVVDYDVFKTNVGGDRTRGAVRRAALIVVVGLEIRYRNNSTITRRNTVGNRAKITP